MQILSIGLLKQGNKAQPLLMTLFGNGRGIGDCWVISRHYIETGSLRCSSNVLFNEYKA